MKKNGRVIERENREGFERSNTELYRLQSLKTATKMRRALKGDRKQSPAHEIGPANDKRTRAKDCISVRPR